MRPFLRAFGVVALLTLAGCGTNDSADYGHGPILGAMTPESGDYAATTDANGMATATPPPAAQVASGVQNLSIANFVDPTGFGLMGSDAQAQAASAQYYALQFGRVGAARTWSGEGNVTGQVSVGPYVKVNNRDCRDFTNVVNIGAKSYTKRGTACREDDGTWTVGAAAAATAPGVTPGSGPSAFPSASGVGAQG